jgi:hypothetical protein
MQTTLQRQDGGLRSPIVGDIISGGAAGAKDGNQEPVEGLRHYRKNGKSPTAKTPSVGEIDVRLQILQQSIRDLAQAAGDGCVTIAALPQEQSTAIVLLGVGYCHNCGSFYNGYADGCPSCIEGVCNE